MYRVVGKRLIDVGVALFILVLGAPIWFVIALLVRLRLGKLILFKQTRIGRNHRSFQLLKFRTMTTERDENGHLLPDEQRLTKLGKLLRKTSLDEVPQLWNVLLGQMSLIGPRPLLPEYLPRYSQFQLRRHEVRPGITGLAQVSGRNAIDWNEKFKFDVQYVDQVTLLQDLKIIIQTIMTVIRPSDVTAQNHATMPEFKGGLTNDEDD